jgi:hypothetical protein
VYALLTVSHTLPEPLKFCPPVEFEAEEGVRVVVAYIEKKPEPVARISRRLRWKPCGPSGRVGKTSDFRGCSALHNVQFLYRKML